MWAPRRFIRLEGLRFRVGRSDLVESKSGSSLTLVLLQGRQLRLGRGGRSPVRCSWLGVLQGRQE